MTDLVLEVRYATIESLNSYSSLCQLTHGHAQCVVLGSMALTTLVAQIYGSYMITLLNLDG